jgi:hypothetical protein
LNAFFVGTDAGDRDEDVEKDTPGEDIELFPAMANGLGDLVGEEEIGDGDGVLANGLRGM